MLTEIILGTLYGLAIGVMPAVGATTGLVALYPFIDTFEPYAGVAFVMSAIAASTTGDSYTGVFLGIPGANSAATTMLDGFPLALKGEAARAISAAIASSTINGIFWGILTFTLLPYYTQLIMILGVPELWAFCILAFSCVVFISTKSWIRSGIALAMGIWLGLIGVNPDTNEPRYTFGWFYLQDGLQLIPVVAGLFAVPEMLDAFVKRDKTATKTNYRAQTLQGIKDWWDNKWLSFKGGFIGAFVGVLPGIGGAVADWMAYGVTVASNPDEEFGEGNIKGVIGPEGANNAQKATSMIPTVLFGIPGASFAAIAMALFAYLGFELGTIEIAEDDEFFRHMEYGFMGGTVFVAILCFILTPILARITAIKYIYYFPLLFAVVVWGSVQYTGGWEDYLILFLASILGLACKKWDFSRASLLIGFILAGRIEGLTVQLTALYSSSDLASRWIFLLIMLVTLSVVVLNLTKGRKKGILST